MIALSDECSKNMFSMCAFTELKIMSDDYGLPDKECVLFKLEYLRPLWRVVIDLVPHVGGRAEHTVVSLADVLQKDFSEVFPFRLHLCKP